MCGIVGHTGNTPNPIAVISGLKRLEYRGYDSAGIVGANGILSVARAVGKIVNLEAVLAAQPFPADAIAFVGHTRWATHGKANETNAHPHVAGNVAVVHNGIIENHAQLRVELEAAGAVFQSDTDTEVIAHLIEQTLKHERDFVTAVQKSVMRLEGAYAIGVVSTLAPDTIVAVRKGSPLVVGLGDGQNMIGSDALAIAEYTPEVMYLNEGDLAVVTPIAVQVYDLAGKKVHRSTKHVDATDLADKGDFPHFMLKEIYEQPDAVRNTFTDDLSAFGPGMAAVLERTNAIHVIACGTSSYAGQTAKRWFTKLGIPTDVFIASEFRYDDDIHVPEGALCIAISQSGETADTLEAMRKAKTGGYLATLAICNTPESSVVREADNSFITQAGREQAVASTKAFTTQLVALQLLAHHLSTAHNIGAADTLQALRELPLQLENVLHANGRIFEAAKNYRVVENAFFLGRRTMVPIAQEGALKLKEISYVHAEAYAAGEMKHGPIALIDDNFLTVAIIVNDGLEEKVASAVEEVLARGSQVLVFAEEGVTVPEHESLHTVRVGVLNQTTAPYLMNVALQLFAYHMAVLRGNDVDQPRNLAKSVTVE